MGTASHAPIVQLRAADSEMCEDQSLRISCMSAFQPVSTSAKKAEKLKC
jgi:hypothetical protein